MQNEPMLKDKHKAKRLKFANCLRTNFRKDYTIKILSSDEKLFDIDEIYNSQNDRICAEADIRQIKRLWLGLKRVLNDFREWNSRYINEALPAALKDANSIFGNNWTFQPDGVKAYLHDNTQKWCADKFPSFIQKDHWPPNSPDLNSLN